MKLGLRKSSIEKLRKLSFSSFPVNLDELKALAHETNEKLYELSNLLSDYQYQVGNNAGIPAGRSNKLWETQYALDEIEKALGMQTKDTPEIED